MENNETWRERLRDLYLTTTPDENGLYTKSISFNWGKFEFDPKDKEVNEFYLTTKNAIEEFIASELLSLADKIGAEKKPPLSPNAGNGYQDQMLDEAHNTALDTAINAIKEMAK